MQSPSHSRASLTLQFWLLAFFLGLVFLMGGASRVDAASLVALRPISVLICAAALFTFRREHWQGRGWLLALMATIFALSLSHVIPLPPAVWQAFPGRAEVAELDRLAGLGDIWRPLSLTPMNGWHAFASLFAPLAVILLGLQLRRNESHLLLIILIGLGVLSGLLGLLQVIGDPNGPLYLYRITNNGSAVGFFANRNHAALMLAMLFPMLAIFASNPEGTVDAQQGRRLLAISLGVVLLPLILVSGSRAGLILTLIGLLSIPALYRRPADGRQVRRGGKRFQIKPLPLFGGLAVLALAMLTIVFSRAQSIERLMNRDGAEDARMDFWKTSIELFWKYFPMGSGSGSFANAYQVIEPNRMLGHFFVNRAHNDWLEVAVTFGLPAVLLMAIYVFAFFRVTLSIWRRQPATSRTTQVARLGSVMVAMLALASVPDYPVRIPIMMCVAAVAGLWLAGGGAAGDRAKDAAWQGGK